MHRHHHAAGEPHSQVSGEIPRLVGNAHVDRLMRRQAGGGERVTRRVGLRKQFREAESLRGPGEQRAQVFARYSHSIVAGGLEEMS